MISNKFSLLLDYLIDHGLWYFLDMQYALMEEIWKHNGVISFDALLNNIPLRHTRLTRFIMEKRAYHFIKILKNRKYIKQTADNMLRARICLEKYWHDNFHLMIVEDWGFEEYDEANNHEIQNNN